MEPLSTLVVLILFAISGFLNGSEVALFSLSRIQLKAIREKFKTAHRTIRKLLGDPAGVLASMLIAGEVVNVALSSLISGAVTGAHGSGWYRALEHGAFSGVPEWTLDAFVSTLVTAPLLLLFCEITPKVVAARANTLLAPAVAAPVAALYRAMTPIRFGIRIVERAVKEIMPGTHREGPLVSTSSKLREEDFIHLVEEARKEGTIQSTELGLIRNVFDLDDTPVREIATPLSRVFMLQQSTTIQQALSSMKEGASGQRYSRVPIYGKNRNEIVGILYSKDLLVARHEREDPSTPISELMWKPFSVSANTQLNSLFRKMKRQRTHLAIVTVPNGNPIGIVTLNDVLEALLDELLIDDDEEAEE